MLNLSITGETITIKHQAAAFNSSGFTLNAMKPLAVINNEIVLVSFSKGERN